MGFGCQEYGIFDTPQPLKTWNLNARCQKRDPGVVRVSYAT